MVRVNTARQGNAGGTDHGSVPCSLTAGNPVQALPAGPSAMSSVFCEFITPLLSTSQLRASQSLLSCSGHDTDHAVHAMAVSLPAPGPLSAGAQQNPIPGPQEGPTEQLDKKHLALCRTLIDSQPFTPSHRLFWGFCACSETSGSP